MKPGNENALDPIQVAKIIKWILDSNINIPIIGVEKL
jgi:hypothetical protein